MKNHHFTPHTHIFLWDLHEVILEKNMRHWLYLCFTFDKKWQLIKNLNVQSLRILSAFILERLKLTKKQMVSEELIHAAHTTKNEALIALVTEVCSAYKPIHGTVDIIQELSKRGYRHHLGSNIGKTVYDHCTTKFPAIFEHFEGATIAFTNPNAKIVKKPHPDFFTTHTHNYNLLPDQVIFIDDKLINVQAAQSVGMHAIQFKNSKQLREELRKLTILE